MSDNIATPYLTAHERIILDAAAAILDGIQEKVYDVVAGDASLTTNSILSAGAIRGKCDAARTALSNALIALDVNAEHYQPAQVEA